MRLVGRVPLAAVLLLAVILPCAPAQAYVRAVTKTGAFWHWVRPSVTIEAYVGDPLPSLSSAELVAAIEGAAAPWTHQRLDCSAVELKVTPILQATAQTKRDGVNRLVFRRQRWCSDPQPANEPCYSPEMLAVTVDVVVVKSGEILESDIEVNAVDHDWSDLVRKPDDLPGAFDLQNALTHEIGHLLGFAHSCLLSPDELARTDDHGAPVAHCGQEGPVAHESTMLAAVPARDVDRRTLSDDDARGVCAVYPPPIALAATQLPDEGGCSVARPSSGPGRPVGLWLPVVAVLFLARRWRSNRRP